MNGECYLVIFVNVFQSSHIRSTFFSQLYHFGIMKSVPRKFVLSGADRCVQLLIEKSSSAQ